jgi:hypothetical protein
MDLNNEGKLNVDEMSIPLVALGLSSDTKFIEMICRSIQPERFKNGNGFLTIQDFMKVFNKDHFADRLLNAIIKRVENKRKIATHKQFRVQEKTEIHKFNQSVSPRIKALGHTLKLNETRSDWDEESLLSRAPSNATSVGGF